MKKWIVPIIIALILTSVVLAEIIKEEKSTITIDKSVEDKYLEIKQSNTVEEAIVSEVNEREIHQIKQEIMNVVWDLDDINKLGSIRDFSIQTQNG